MSWDRTGQKVSALYLKAHPVSGTVLDSRVKYGGTVQHTLQLDPPRVLFGTHRDLLIVNEPEVTGVLA